MPVPLFKGDELRSSEPLVCTCDRLRAATALLGKEFAKAIGAVGSLVLGGELLTGEHLVTVGAGEAIAMERSALVGDSSLVDHAIAFGTALSILLLIAGYTDDLLVARDEALVSNWLVAHLAAEALLMPLFTLVLKLLHASPKDVLTSITPGSEVVVMAIGTVQFLVFGRKRLVYERTLTIAAFKASLVPVLILVGQILGVSANGRLAVLTAVGKEVFIAFDAEWMFVPQDVAMSGERQVAVPAAEVPGVPVLVHGFGVLTRKD